MGFVEPKWFMAVLLPLCVVLAVPRNPSKGFGFKPSRHDGSTSTREELRPMEDVFSEALDHDAQNEWENLESSSTWEGAQEAQCSTSASLSHREEVMQSRLLQVPCGLQQQHEDDFDTKISPVSAFVDTGAQVTVLSKHAASKAGLLHLLDRRYAGHATGVGQCRVLGRIPAKTLLIHMGDALVEGPAITVLESTGTDGVDLLLGLDFLRDHHAILSLFDEEMRLFCDSNSPVTIPFIRPRRSHPKSRNQTHRSNSNRGARQRMSGPYLFEQEQEHSSFGQESRQEASYLQASPYENFEDKVGEQEEAVLSDDFSAEEDYHDQVDLSGV